MNQIEHCSAELLAEIAESEDFQRGLLWLSVLSVSDEEHLLAIIHRIDVTSVDLPALNYELLVLLDDARRIHWLHPGRDAKTLEVEVVNIAQKFGWQVSGDYETCQKHAPSDEPKGDVES